MKRMRIIAVSGLIALALTGAATAKPPRLTPEAKASLKDVAAAAEDAARNPNQVNDSAAEQVSTPEEMATAARNADKAMAEANAATDRDSQSADRAEDANTPAPDPDCANGPIATAPDSPPFDLPTRIDQPFGNAYLGAKGGKVRLVVFADYACEACRISQPTLDRLVAEEPDLTVIFRLIPNDPGGEDPATLSLAVARTRGQAEWSKFHHAVDSGNSVEPAALNSALTAAGVKPKCYYSPGSPTIDAESLNETGHNRQLAEQRKLKAFPSWVIGKGPVTVELDYTSIKAAIAKAKAAVR